MIQINLLPWREQARKEQKTRLAFMAGGCAVFAILMVGLTHLHYRSEINGQEERNKAIMAELEKENTAMFSLKKQKEEAEIIDKQLKFIFSLRDSSYRAVEILDELAKVSPDTITLEKVTRKGNTITIAGKAKSNLQITLFMEKIEDSELFDQPVLTKISGKDSAAGLDRSFLLRVEMQRK